MRHVQTRIRIGRGGLAFGVGWLLVLAMSWYTQANLLFWVLGVMAGVAGTSWLYAVFTMRGVEVVRTVPEHAEVSEPMVLRYQVTQRRRPGCFGVTLTELPDTPEEGEQAAALSGPPMGWVLHLPPRHTVEAQAVTRCRSRGVVRFNRLEVQTSYPFGVFKRVLVFEEAQSVTVLPELRRLQRQMLGALTRIDPIGQQSVDKPGGMDDFYGLRPYREGDPLHLVDWKHSAKRDTLVARERSQRSSPRVMLHLDLKELAKGTPGQASEQEVHALGERAVSLAASVLQEAHLRGLKIGLSWSGAGSGAISPHHSPPHRKRVLHALARLKLEALDDGQPTTAVAPNLIVRLGVNDPEGAGAIQAVGMLRQPVISARMDTLLLAGSIDTPTEQDVGQEAPRAKAVAG